MVTSYQSVKFSPLKVSGYIYGTSFVRTCITVFLAQRELYHRAGKFRLKKKFHYFHPPTLMGEFFYPTNFCPMLMTT